MNLKFLLVLVLVESQSWTWRRKSPPSLKGALSSFLARPTRKYSFLPLSLLPVWGDPVGCLWVAGLEWEEAGHSVLLNPIVPCVPLHQALLSPLRPIPAFHHQPFCACGHVARSLGECCSRFSSSHNPYIGTAVEEYLWPPRYPTELEATALVLCAWSCLGHFLNEWILSCFAGCAFHDQLLHGTL